MKKLLSIAISFTVLLSSAQLSLASTAIKQFSKIKVEYPNRENISIDEEILVRVKKDFQIDDQTVIPEGTEGYVKVTELTGAKKDKVKNAVGYLVGPGEIKIPIQMKRPKKRPFLTTVVATLGVIEPISFTITEFGKHKFNRIALKDTYYVMEDLVLN